MTDHDASGVPHRNWWTTLPGVLTALAALITAVAGLVAVLPKAEPGTAASVTAAPTPAAAPQAIATVQGRPSPGVANTTASEARPSANDAAVHRGATALVDSMNALRARGFKGAVLTLEDGSLVPLSNQVREYAKGAPALRLSNGQEVAFDRMEQFEVVAFDDRARRGQVVIHLLNGSRLEADVDAYGMAGSNELGPFLTTFEKVRRVQFLR